MIHFVNDPSDIALLIENLDIAQSMIETAMPETAQNRSLKFRRGSAVVTFEHHRILLQRQAGFKLRESFQVDFSFGGLVSPYADRPADQAVALATAELFSSLLTSGSQSNRVGDPYENLPAELDDLFTVHALAALLQGAKATDQVHLALPSPYHVGKAPVARVEISGEQYAINETILRNIAGELPSAVYQQITHLTDAGTKSISWDLWPLSYGVSLEHRVNALDQMKAMAKYQLIEEDLELLPVRGN